jgi:hypothetical protein
LVEDSPIVSVSLSRDGAQGGQSPWLRENQPQLRTAEHV